MTHDRGVRPGSPLLPDEGLVLEARGSLMTFKAVSAITGGRFSLMHRTLPPGGRMPPAHRHPATAEAFYVLHGEVTFRLDDRQATAHDGGFVLVPEGLGHAFGNLSADAASVLVVHAPALDAYFEDLASLWSGPRPPTPEAELALMRRHGLEPLDEGQRG